jgi:hypothetical protein
MEDSTMQSKKGVFILFIMILITTNSWAQEPAPPLDPTPLARPVPLSIIKVDTNLALLDIIADTLARYKFDLVRRDDREQLIEAKRMDAPDSKDHDKVLIWLEKDFQEPEKYIKIFCQYGRFLKIWDEVKRVKIDPEEETERIGKLKQAIISISKLTR